MPRPLTVAVVTADLIGSTGYTPTARRKLQRVLLGAFKDTRRRWRHLFQAPLEFRITAGDEFQWVLTDPSRCLHVILYLRAVLASPKAPPRGAFRASIGIGDITVVQRKNPYEEDGRAFENARRGLERLHASRSPRRWTVLTTGDTDFDRSAHIVLTLMDHFQQEWTREQWEAVRWILLGMKREQIGSRLGVAHQNVTKRLAAADWASFAVAFEYLREQIAIRHPYKGAKGL